MPFRYSGINAKIRAMSGRLLKPADYEVLIGQKTVEEVVGRLSERGDYARVLSKLSRSEMHRGFIEQKMTANLAGDFNNIYFYLTDFGLREYLSAFFLNNRIDVIKFLLGAVCDERDMSYSLPDIAAVMGGKMGNGPQEAVSAKTVPEFIEALRGTVFHGALSKNFSGGMPELFDMETELDIYYYMNLWDFTRKKADRGNRKAMADIVGTQIDLKNIIWICRLKSNYNVSENVIYAHLIPARHRLTREQIAEMAEAADMAELRKAVGRTAYGGCFGDLNRTERAFHHYMNGIYRRSRAKNPGSLANAVSYLYFKELEIKNIISVIECVRYGLGRDETLEYLVI